ncbi:oligosaccharide flippase family protein [Sphingomonas endolithica]|uniref:oligosaccharide flippase family protein n=1 Tax=Sphingomonas endolithica TaxID=2972485 RepID=UPI0021AFFB1E|nr:oligosaccharide flippase family protein [Sphingomonas sp. ZFBP2030]
MSIKRSLAWMGIAQAATFLFQFGSSVVLARYLTPQEMGVFAIGLAMVGMLAVLQNFGLQPLIVREETLTRPMEATTFTANTIICIVQTIATFLFAFVAASFLRNEGVKHILVVLSVVPLFGILSFMPGAKLERNGRFKEIALIGAVTSLIGSSATIIFAVLGFKYMSLAYGQVISAITLSASFIIVGRRYWFASFGLSEWKYIFGFGVQMFSYSGIVNLSQRFCEIMLGRILGLSALGLYNRASGINNMIWGNIHYLASRVMLVDFANHHRSGIPIGDRYIQTVAVITATLWPAFAGLAILAHPFIVIVYGAKWAAAAVPLVYLTLSSIILVAMTMSWELFTVTGNVGTQTRLEAVRTIVSVLLFVGACFISIEAVAFTRIIDAAFIFVLYRPYLNKMTGTSFRGMAKTYLQSTLLTLAAILPVAILMLTAKGAQPSLLMLLCAITSGILLWGVSLFIVHHPLTDEIRAIRTRVLTKPS